MRLLIKTSSSEYKKYNQDKKIEITKVQNFNCGKPKSEA